MRTEGNAKPLHFRHEVRRRVILSAVENHVLQEMGDALLVVRLHQRSGRNVEA